MKINRQKIISGIFIVIVSILFCLDILFNPHILEHPFVCNVIHCIGVGIIVLMFSRELRGEAKR